MPVQLDTGTPVLVLGGKENSLSLTRHFGRLGIVVRASGTANCWAMHSRYCREKFPVPEGVDAGTFWTKLLLSDDGGNLDGHIVLACSDAAIEFLAANRAGLTRRYILDDADPQLQTALLDKARTIELARDAGISAPNFWKIESDADIEKLRGAVTFPVMVKPIHSHRFAQVFHRKLFIVRSGFDEMAEKLRLVRAHHLEAMVVEMIPGPDALLSSYYTYVDRSGRNLFHYTKRVLRQFPVNGGGACAHLTEWLPETAEMGRKFFDAVGFRGLGNIEFKRDPRDGRLKIIEVNARFTASQELAVRAGMPIHLVVYCHLTHQPVPQIRAYRQFLHYWFPLRDLLAFVELRRRGEMGIIDWLRSVLPYRHVFPLWALHDLAPCVGATSAALRQVMNGRGP